MRLKNKPRIIACVPALDDEVSIAKVFAGVLAVMTGVILYAIADVSRRLG